MTPRAARDRTGLLLSRGRRPHRARPALRAGGRARRDALAAAVRYHPARRWFARHGVVRHSAPGITYFRPAEEPYGRLRPLRSRPTRRSPRCSRCARRRHGTASLPRVDGDAARRPGGGRAPGARRATLDGTPTIHALCPSHPDVVEYAAALSPTVRATRPGRDRAGVRPVRRVGPLVRDLLELAPPTGAARAFAGQCFCDACDASSSGRPRPRDAAPGRAGAGGSRHAASRTRPRRPHCHGGDDDRRPRARCGPRPLIFDDAAMAAFQGAARRRSSPPTGGVGCGP